NCMFTQRHRSRRLRAPVAGASRAQRWTVSERNAGLSASTAGDHGLDNRQVSDDPRKRGEVREGHPPSLEVRRTRARCGRTGRHLGEPHAHDAPTQDRPPLPILGAHALADRQARAELLGNLAREGFDWIFIVLDLAAGQLELPAQLLRVGARACEQHRGLAQGINDRGRHHGTRHGNSNQSGDLSVSGARERAGATDAECRAAPHLIAGRRRLCGDPRTPHEPAAISHHPHTPTPPPPFVATPCAQPCYTVPSQRRLRGYPA
ncbi:hypothetical protein, partial [Corynebacterium durum]